VQAGVSQSGGGGPKDK